MKTRYEFVGGTSKKFWEVEPPILQSNGGWVVRVHFGRIATDGQRHFNVFWSEQEALAHYDRKVNEKLGKGYKEVKQALPPKPQPAMPYMVPSKKAKPVCEHNQLRKTAERKWACNACGVHIEFDKPQANTPATTEVAQVRRFIDMAALSGGA